MHPIALPDSSILKISTLYQSTPLLFPPMKRVSFKNSTTISPYTRPYLRCTQQNAIFLPIHGTFSRALYILVISCRSRTVVPCIHRRISPPRWTPGLSPSLTNLLHPKRSEELRGRPCERRAIREKEEGRGGGWGERVPFGPGRGISFRIHAVRTTGTE